MKWHSSHSVKYNIGIVITVAILLEAISAVQYYYAHHLLNDELELRVLSELRFKAFALQQTLEQAELSLQEHLWYINEYLEEPDSMFVATQRLIHVNEKVVGGCLAFVPNYYPQKGRLFEPYAYEECDTIKVEQIGGKDGHDYTENPAFLRMMSVKRPFWSDPYKYESATGPLSLTTYSYPLLDKQGEIIAVCGIDVSLSWLGDTLNARHIHSSSFDLFLTGAGELIAGPSEDRVSQQRVQHLVALINDSTVRRESTNNERVKVINFYDEERHDEGFIYYASMKNAPQWQVALVCYEDEAFGKVKTMRLYVSLLMLAGFLLLLLVIRRTVNNVVHLQRANMEKERISGELRIAQNIQQQMLPKQFPPYPERDDIDIYGSLVPAREVGGDIFDFFLRDEKLFFCIGDVSGKGVPSAMVMAQTHSLFRMATSREHNPARIMQTINEVVCEGNDTNMFITLFIGILDLPTGRLRYCNAGHDHPILTGKDTTEIPAMANLPIGTFSDFRYEGQEQYLPAGTMIFLYTDGLTEAKNNQHKQFGLERVRKVVGENSLSTPKQLLKWMDDEVHRFTEGAEQSDDLTMLAIRYTPKEEVDWLNESITLTNDIHQVSLLNAFVKSVAQKLEIESVLARKLQLAVEEAVVNVMDYAYPVGKDGSVTITAKGNGKNIKLVIRDSGIPFDPTVTAKTDTTLSAEERPIGGLGILLVRELMDSINYERIDGKNVLTLTKRIKE